MGIRFTQALFEASTFSGTHVSWIGLNNCVAADNQYILGSWYKTGEFGKRSAVVRLLSPLAKTLVELILIPSVCHLRPDWQFIQWYHAGCHRQYHARSEWAEG